MRGSRSAANRLVVAMTVLVLAACAVRPPGGSPDMGRSIEQAIAHLPPEQRAQYEEIVALSRQGRHQELQARIESLEQQSQAMGRELVPLSQAIEAEQHEYQFEAPMTLYQRPLTVETALSRGRMKRLFDPTVFARDMKEFAELSRVRGDPAGEEAFFRRILAEREAALGPAHPDVAVALRDLAELCKRERRFEEGRTLYERALGIHEQSPAAVADIATALSDLADLHLQRGDAPHARPLLERALAMRQALGPDHPHHAAGLANLGVAHDALGSTETAERLYAEALAMYERRLALPDESLDADELRHGATVVLSNAGLIAWRRGDLRQATARFTRAQVYRSNWWRFLDRLSERQVLTIGRSLAEETEALISLDRAGASTQPEATLLALSVLLERRGQALEGLTRTAVAAQTAPVAQAAPRGRARVASDDHDDGWPSEDRADLSQLRTDLANVRARLSQLQLSGSGDDPVARRAEITALEKKERALQARLARGVGEERDRESDERAIQRLAGSARVGSPGALAAAARDFSPAPIELPVASRDDLLRKVRAALPGDSALVEFATYRPFDARSGKWGERRYVAYVLRPAGAPSAADLGDIATIDRLVAQFRRALARPTGNAVLRVARELDARFMQPIRAMLGDARHVLVSPEGALHLVPLAALRDEQERWLVERYTFTYLTTGRELLREPAPPAREPVTILADPDFAGEGAETVTAAATRSIDFRRIEFERLPGTAEEAAAIAGRLPGARLLTRAQATEAALKQVKGPEILHVASHAFFLEQREAALENPLLRSGLVLAGANRLSSGNEDGILTALEAASLDLAGTNLVVLSACETGLGDVQSGEGVYGLRRALVIAGAATQVMSLWKVADEKTRDLMIAFYDQLGQGAGRSGALRDAQLGVLRDQRTSHPFFWAGFIVSGDWRPLERATAASGVHRP